MRCKRAVIDSLNLASPLLESIFIHSEDYTLQMVKRAGKYEPKEWLSTFGSPMKQNVIRAQIVHTHRGLCLPLKTFANMPQSQTLEFAGLRGYNDRSEQMRETLAELESRLQSAKVTRIDIAVDFRGKIPKGIIKSISGHREPFRWHNTAYFKTAKEKKVNGWLDIKIYDKQKQANLDYPMTRLEFCFKSGYFKDLEYRNIETVFPKMEKTIKKMAGLTVCIKAINDVIQQDD